MTSQLKVTLSPAILVTFLTPAPSIFPLPVSEQMQWLRRNRRTGRRDIALVAVRNSDGSLL